MSLFTKLQHVKIPIEVNCFFFVLSFVFAESVTTNFVMYRTCYVTLDYNNSDCALLGSTYPNNNTANLEKVVQPYATHLVMTRHLMQAIGSAAMCFFLGPWSDTYGRKPVIVAVNAGTTLTLLLMAIVSAFPALSPWYFLVTIAPMCLVGGTPTISAVALVYITDTTSGDNIAVRLGIIEAIIAASILIGSASSSFILNATSYLTIYLISTCIMTFASTITYMFVAESLPNPKTEERFKNIFNFSLVKDTFKSIFAKRKNYDRALLITISISTIILLFVGTADATLGFLYLRRKLNWSLQQHTLYMSGNQIVGIAWSFIGSYLLYKILKIQESSLIMIGFVCLFSGSLLQGLAIEDWQVYFAGALNCFGCVTNLMARCLASKIIPEQDYGKVFSLTIVIETLFSLIGSPLYAVIYNKTLSTLPGAYNFVSAGIYSIEIMLALAIIIMQRQRE